MNAFKVKKDSGDAFEAAWRDRDTYLDEVPGILHFALLRGDAEEGKRDSERQEPCGAYRPEKDQGG